MLGIQAVSPLQNAGKRKFDWLGVCVCSHGGRRRCRVRCSALHAPGAVLIGDAAHSVTASVGHGCDAAVEDGALLGRIAATAGGSSHPPQVS